MKKLCLIFCVMLLLSVQTLAYEVTDTYVFDGVMYYVVHCDDGSYQDMTQEQYDAYAAQRKAAQEQEAQQEVQEPQEGQVITAAGDIIDYADYDAYYEENPEALLQNSSAGTFVRSYAADTDNLEEGSMKYVVRSIFGSYTPVTESVTTYLADGSAVTSTQVVAGVAGVDWPFICGVALFSILLYSFLRLLGVILHV